MMELVVVLAVMSILTLIAVPNYRHIIGRFQYLEILHELAPWRIQVEMCFWQNGSLDSCSSGSGGINEFDTGHSIESLDVAQGYITIAPRARRGLSTDDQLVMAPYIDQQVLKWRYEGPAVEQGYVQQS